MFRKFLILLVLLIPAQLFAQVDYTFTQYTGVPQVPPLANINQTGGTPMNLWDDEVKQTQIGFNFKFYGESFSSAFISSNGLISFQYPVNGCCGGYNFNDPGNEYSIFAVQTDLINIQTLNPYTKLIGEEGFRQYIIGWYDMPIFYDSSFRSTLEITLFEGSNNILINYGDVNNGGRFFTAGIKGSNIDGYELIYTGSDGNFLDYTSYLFTPNSPPPPPPPTFLYWDRLAGEYESFTLTSPGVVRYGANGVYVYQSLEAGTYGCNNSLFGDPIGGVVKSCELGSNEPPVTAVDCAVDPYDTTCIINSVTSDQTYFASEETGSDNGSDDGSDYFEQSADEEEELLADEESSGEELFDEIIESPVDSEETDLEEMLADEEELDEEAETVLVANKEIANEEKASTLSDSISKNILEAALSVASAAETAGSTAGASETQSSSLSTKTSSAGESQTITAESVASIDSSTEAIKEENASLESALEILETGRLIGRDALEATMAIAESSAVESVSVAETVAAVSAETSTAFAVAESLVVIEETTTNQETQFVVANENEQTTPTDKTTETVTEQTEMVVDNIQTDQSSAVSYSDIESVMEVFAGNLPNQIDVNEQEELENNIIQQSIAATQTQQEETNTFGEAEAVTIASDPNLAAAFNMAPNMMNLEVTGVLNNKQEEKSDAEKRADEVVAANAKEQEEINKNYMEADQSGIVAAMGADTDVGAYRTAMIRDNNNWYKPEDIYKGVVYKDNARGAYFLEKGNTDTYKKMVEEQYK